MNFLRNNLKTIVPVGLVGLLVAAGVAWWLISPLFITNQVDEAFPFDVPTSAELADMPADEAMAMIEDKMMEAEEMMESGEISAETAQTVQMQLSEAAADMPDSAVVEEMPEMEEAAADEWVVAAQGSFVDADAFHQGSGTATIFEQGDQRILRLEDFEVTNGPALKVLLVENPTALNHEELGEYVDLGALKGNVGNQNYEIPADIDLSKYAGIMIYCEPFSVVFSTASFQ